LVTAPSSPECARCIFPPRPNVLGMALTYTLAGVAAGLSGSLLSTALQTPWVLGTFSALFVLLALSMFGLYELRLPQSWQDWLTAVGRRVPGGRAAAAWFMGVLSALLVGPCIAAPLAGALLYIGQTRDVVLGGAALFYSLALGMGAPLIAVGASAGTLLPEAGPWMVTVQRFFGVVLLAVAIWIVSPVVPPAVHMALWALLLITGSGVSPARSIRCRRRRRVSTGSRKSTGVVALVIGAALLAWRARRRARICLQPLGAFRAGSRSGESPAVPFERINNQSRSSTRAWPPRRDKGARSCSTSMRLVRDLQGNGALHLQRRSHPPENVEDGSAPSGRYPEYSGGRGAS